MKNRNKLIVALAFVCLLVLIGILLDKKTPITSPTELKQADVNADTSTEQITIQETNLTTNLDTQTPLPPGSDTTAKIVSREQDLLRQWKVPIEFFGRVLDENDQPVPDAQIKFNWNDLSVKGTDQREAVSDSSGDFYLTGAEGKTLYVFIGKDGYYVPRAEIGRGFEYAENLSPQYYQPDRNAPVIFHLRKKGKADPLITGKKLLGFKADGTTYYVDLETGAKHLSPPEKWDVAIKFNRSIPGANRKFDWSVTFETSGGGILETEEEFAFLAPADGYQTSLQIMERADDPTWVRQVKKKFFIRSRSGQIYSRIEAAIMPWYQNEAAIDMNYFFNPSGSRNLEYDPQNTVTP